MIFAHTWQQVLDGTKTQTRRGYRPENDFTYEPYVEGSMRFAFTDGEHVPRVGDFNRDRDKFSVGRTLAVQPGRGKQAVARIEITQIRYCAVAGNISTEDARAEGFMFDQYGDFDPIGEFQRTYARINGERALAQPCWALTFVLVERAATDTEG